MTTLDRTAGGKTVAESTEEKLPTAAGSFAFTVTVDDLHRVDYVIRIDADPSSDFDPGHAEGVSIQGNELGATLFGVGSGGTINVTARVAGT